MKSCQDWGDGKGPSEGGSALLVRGKLTPRRQQQFKPAPCGFPEALLCPAMDPTANSSHLHVTVQLHREASMLHLNGLHAGLHCPGAAGPIVENHFQVLLLVLKEDIGAVASQLEVLPIKGDDVPSGTARAHT